MTAPGMWGGEWVTLEEHVNRKVFTVLLLLLIMCGVNATADTSDLSEETAHSDSLCNETLIQPVYERYMYTLSIRFNLHRSLKATEKNRR